MCALAVATGSGAHAAIQSTNGRAITLGPLSIVKVRDLDFGTVIPGATAGTVVINASTDVRTTTGGVTGAGGAPQAAQFYSWGTGNLLLVVSLSAAPTLSRAGGGATMAVTNLTLNGPAIRILPPAGLYDLRVGGTLAVGANQLDGVYSGAFTMTVTYF